MSPSPTFMQSISNRASSEINRGIMTVGSVAFADWFPNNADVSSKSTAMDEDHLLLCYRDNLDNGKGKAVIITKTGESLGVGTAAQFSAFAIWSYEVLSVEKINSTQAIVVWRRASGDREPRGCVLTWDGSNGVSAGSEVILEAGVVVEATCKFGLSRIDDSRAIFSFNYYTTSNEGFVKILTISGGSITPGSSYLYDTVEPESSAIVALDSTNAIVAYSSNNNVSGESKHLTISGDVITVGNSFQFSSSAAAAPYISKISNSKAIVTYQASSAGRAIILNLVGPNIVGGDVTTFLASGVNAPASTNVGSDQAVVCFRLTTDGYKGYAIPLNINGDTITAGTHVDVTSANSIYAEVTNLDDVYSIYTYWDSTNARGRARLLKLT
jgi:hypothetical protein